ncbi:MAG: glucose-fructose oxidoreductase [Acidobacteria bacterium]|nr:MAG: glucose-fructose oxidoreductase [Acidobacteriota bacterium]
MTILNNSRRDFLRQLLLGTGALATGINLWGKDSAEKSKDRKLGVALLGLGRYSSNELAPALQQTKQCYLAGVITGHPEKGEQWAAKYNLNKKNIYNYDNLEQIAHNPDIDIVYVVTPPALHPEFAIRVAKAGKHVISEKPMATSVEDCTRMIAACKKAKVKLAIGYRLHYDLYHKEMMRLAKEQDFGPFMKMTGDRGFIFGQRAWRIDKKLAGGGPMMDLGIYIIHGACMAANGVAPVSVTAHEEPKLKPELFNEVEETMRWTMDFPNGAKCEAITSYNHSADRGPLSFPAINQQAAHMDDFADCILTGRDTSVPGELGRRDIQIITAIYEAARTGKPVKVKA